MKIKKTFLTYAKYFLLIFISIIFFALLYPFGKTDNEAKVKEFYSKYSSVDGQTTKKLVDNLSEIIDKVGIDGAAGIVAIAKKNSDIDASECHSIMHLLGHQTYSRRLEVSFYLKEFGNRCEAGFLHGIEAQITLEETDVVRRNEKLKQLCSAFMKDFHNSACYHGVGHAYYQTLRDPVKALKACDTLASIDTDLNPCYRGVFNELTYDIQGIDGETGLRVPGEHKKIERPDLYCDSIKDEYKDQCLYTIARSNNAYIPVPPFVAGLTGDESKIIIVTPQIELTSEEKKTHDELVRKLGVSGKELDLATCKPVKPLVMNITRGKGITVINSSSKVHTINLNKDTSYSVKPQGRVVIDSKFFDGFAGVYGFGCDYTPYAVGYFVIESSKSNK